MNDEIVIWTDGSCLINPGGPGGWACVLVRPDGTKDEFSGFEPSTTNNRMELLAAIRGLEALGPVPQAVNLTTDSQYVRNGITLWIAGWKRKGWRTADHKDVKNQDLWQQLDQLCNKHSVIWLWVRGHVGDKYNERCDELASLAARQRSVDESRKDQTQITAGPWLD